MDNWEKEFDKEFLRKHTFYDSCKDATSPHVTFEFKSKNEMFIKDIKQFIRTLLEEERKKTRAYTH